MWLCLKKRIDILQSSIDDLEQYDRRNNLISPGIPDGVSDDDLEEIVGAIRSDIDVKVTASDVEECHGIGQSDKNKSRKQLSALWTENIVEKSWKTKKMASNDLSKYNFPVNTKIFADENLTFKNETLAIYQRNLKRGGHVFSSYTRNGVVFIKDLKDLSPKKYQAWNHSMISFQIFSVEMKKLMPKDLPIEILKFGANFGEVMGVLNNFTPWKPILSPGTYFALRILKPF